MKPTKFDEFGDVDEREFDPKLNRFFDALRENKDLQGYIIFYGGKNETAFKQTDFYLGQKTRAFYKYIQRRFDAPQVTVARAGLRETPMTELWLVPRGGDFPYPKEETPARAKDIKNKLKLVGTEKLDFAEAKIEKENASRIEGGTIVKTGKSSAEFPKELSDSLKKDAARRAVLIFYADDNVFDIEKSRQTLERLLQESFKTSGLDASRVKIVYGGYREKPEIETWILPPDGIEPEPVPDFKITDKN